MNDKDQFEDVMLAKKKGVSLILEDFSFCNFFDAKDLCRAIHQKGRFAHRS